MTDIKTQLTSAMKDAMRAKEKQRLSTIRMAIAAIKQIEIDEQITISNEQALVCLDKMVKKRREAAKIFQDAERQELADKEQFEISVLQDFLPDQLSESEQDCLISEAISQTNASEMRDMGKVMGVLRTQVQGKVDMSAFSAKIKKQLSN